jgi:hypothetical protein
MTQAPVKLDDVDRESLMKFVEGFNNFKADPRDGGLIPRATRRYLDVLFRSETILGPDRIQIRDYTDMDNRVNYSKEDANDILLELAESLKVHSLLVLPPLPDWTTPSKIKNFIQQLTKLAEDRGIDGQSTSSEAYAFVREVLRTI